MPSGRGPGMALALGSPRPKLQRQMRPCHAEGLQIAHPCNSAHLGMQSWCAGILHHTMI